MTSRGPGARITLVRHGQSTWNELNLIQGQNDDAVLTRLGQREALAVGNSLKSLGFSRVITSDLRRARQTAEIIAATLDLSVSEDPRLRERCFGSLQGQPLRLLDPKASGIVDGVLVDPDARPVGGESFRDVVTRVGSFLAEVRDAPGLLVVTHGGAIRALHAYVDDTPLAGLVMMAVGNCSVWELTLAPTSRA
ncbi:MAG TPA: histidine phosphatase family protein [Acidimicrobiales bacterium]|nr:histidine phosphatase family protein [Acidimicrobiales bacterium]